MRQVWVAALGVLSVVAIGCVAVAGPKLAGPGSLVRVLFGRQVAVHAAESPVFPDVPVPAQPGQGEGALDLVIPEWMGRGGEKMQVRFPGGRTHALPLFTRVPAGVYMLEFSGTSYKPVLCQVQVNPRSRSRVTFGGQNCRVELND